MGFEYYTLVLGNGIPDLELGWSNNITIGDWNINAFFRGAFGHPEGVMLAILLSKIKEYNTKIDHSLMSWSFP